MGRYRMGTVLALTAGFWAATAAVFGKLGSGDLIVATGWVRASFARACWRWQCLCVWQQTCLQLHHVSWPSTLRHSCLQCHSRSCVSVSLCSCARAWMCRCVLAGVQMQLALRGASIAGLLLCNAIMVNFFTKALRLSSPAAATALSASSNFCLTVRGGVVAGPCDGSDAWTDSRLVCA